ncbi:hypothetical protein [Mucilaginibacter sp. SP1R1]|uniref:hypothetical protein n=1 Tax=Mucilaginibacter sp. SP1R1 TaxID=2723091 RepID=UPI00161678AD|nr:hypothetical protein [Mucilaginibacter sp. SP1R1]MBB6149421.1 hypothetical protein [Mucilaginibacter sp. SP1R1]
MNHIKSIIKLSTLFSCLLFIALSSSAQETRIIRCKIYDAGSKEAIPAAIISDNAGHAATSDAGGNFKLQTSAVALEVRLVGYQTDITKEAGSFFFKTIAENTETLTVSALE